MQSSHSLLKAVQILSMKFIALFLKTEVSLSFDVVTLVPDGCFAQLPTKKLNMLNLIMVLKKPLVVLKILEGGKSL